MKIKAYAKVNIFLKVVGLRGNLHLIKSRFMRVNNLYDTIEFVKKDNPNKTFELVGDFGCKLEQNTIYKAYENLITHSNNQIIQNFFDEHKILVTKKIPEFAGLGGGSSDAAAFLNLTNQVLALRIPVDTLAVIGAKIGADIPFFVYNYPSANVSGIGEVVEEFKEDILNIESITPDIKCDTAKVYQKYRSTYIDQMDTNFATKLSAISSKEILDNYKDKELNDLLSPCIDLYPKLKDSQKENWFFSGSGSTFFKVNNG